MKRTPLFQKALSLLTLAVYLLTPPGPGFAVSGPAVDVMAPRETPAFLQIDIPSELAEVEEIYEAPPRVDPNLIIHIQDAHGNYDAQRNIRDLMQYLHEAYGFKLFFVEGAVDQLNPDYIRLFNNDEYNAEAAQYLAREGKITGAELFLVDAPEDVAAVGIEQAELYKANYDAFRKVYAGKDDTDFFLQQLDVRLTSLASRFFSKELKELVQEWRRFESGQRDFLPYVKNLAEAAQKHLDVDLGSLFAQVEWPQLSRLLLLQSMEQDLDLELGREEKDAVVAFLRKHNLSPELIEAIQEIEETHIRMNRLEAADNRKENLPRYLIERLMEEAAPAGFVFQDYPAFSLYAGYFILKSEVDSTALFEEIELLFRRIIDSRAESLEEKKLVLLFRDRELLGRFFSLELTREDWYEFQRRQGVLEPHRISQRAAEMESSVQSLRIPFNLADVFSSGIEFYRYAQQREKIFYYKIRQGMETHAEEKSTLLTGGFHTDGVFERFREEETNYGVLMPRIRGEINRDAYIKAMIPEAAEGAASSTLMVHARSLPPPVRSQITGVPVTEQAWADAYDLLNVFGTRQRYRAKTGRESLSYGEFIEAVNEGPAARAFRFTLRQSADSDKAYLYFFDDEGTPAAVRHAGQFVVVKNDGNVPLVTTDTRAPREEEYPVEIEARAPFIPPADDAFSPGPLEPPPAQSRYDVLEERQRILQQELSDLFERRDVQMKLGPFLQLLNQDLSTRAANAANAEERDYLLGLTSTLVGFGLVGTDESAQAVGQTLGEVLRLTDASDPLYDSAMDSVKKAYPHYASDLEARLIRVRSEDFSEEEYKGIAAQLALNPNAKVAVVFVPPEGQEEQFEESAMRRHVLERIEAAAQARKLKIEGLTNRTAVRTTSKIFVERIFNEIKRDLFQISGREEANNHLVFNEAGIRGLKTSNGSVLDTDVDTLRDVQGFVALALARNLAQAAGQGNLDDEYMQAVKIDERTKDQITRFEIDEDGLQGLQATIRRLLAAAEAAASLQSAA